ncbi:cobalt-precorrin 5A hydrolase [Propionispira arboris]|uniref:Cobalt-precorrin 5A hydrolase n=1 Tax=Propionispira arboris TaxID=84035 RepID=A0A1H6W9Y5_9FIRM|nr:cobalt-precorrin 5A hydrolase [Propionispira arboris]SEJ10837.1 cobalt-precorrin 5A hydrolase [Propionispira arboris]
MKTAVFAVTQNGAKLADQIACQFDYDLFVKKGRYDTLSRLNFHDYDSLSNCLKDTFHSYDALIFIMATGIVVRTLAPFIIDKRSDPAVVVLDEKAQHVISLLSGHIGGANALTKKLALFLGAAPVITTATDVNEKMAVDLLAESLNLSMEPFDHLKYINAEIVQGNPVDFFIDQALTNAPYYIKKLQACQIEAKLMEIKTATCFSRSSVILTEQLNIPNGAGLLFLKPRKLAIGIGCRRDTTQAEILQAIQTACEKIGKSMYDIACIASTVVKKDEPGLIAASKTLSVPLYFYENVPMQQMIDLYSLDISPFVTKQIGIGNVCEAAVLLASQSKKILLHKTKLTKVTVAIAWEK